MSGDLRDLNAALEGDDIPPPIRVFQFGKHFVSADSGALTATGPECLATLARKLLARRQRPTCLYSPIPTRSGPRAGILSRRSAACGPLVPSRLGGPLHRADGP